MECFQKYPPNAKNSKWSGLANQRCVFIIGTINMDFSVEKFYRMAVFVDSVNFCWPMF